MPGNKPSYVDIVGVTGSNPVAPTIFCKELASIRAGLAASSGRAKADRPRDGVAGLRGPQGAWPRSG